MGKITKRSVMLLCFSMTFIFMYAQNQHVSGIVIDNTGEALIGVSVAEKGTGNGTITNQNGEYTLAVGKNAVLVFSYVGYTIQEIAVTDQSIVNVTMEEDTKALDEVVVVGYGTMKRRDLTGAISSIKAADIEKVASSNAMQALQARVPGLDITQNDGQAGSGLSMTVRGNRSVSASNSPLILVDGIEYGSTIDINASDIESMEVLKDAASTAIYGTKGANGVIIITTKRGQAGKTRVNFNAYLSSNIPTSYSAPLFGQKEVDALIAKKNYDEDSKTGNWGSTNSAPADVLNLQPDGLPAGQIFTALDVYNDGKYVNWFDYFMQNGLTQNYEVSVAGGDAKTLFNTSVGAMFEEGLLKNDKLNRFNGKLSVDHTISKYAKVGTTMFYTYRNQDKRNSSIFTQALKMTSIARPYNQDGSIIATPSAFYKAHASPLLDDVEGNYANNVETTRFFGNAYFEINPFIKGLMFKSMFALDRTNFRTGGYQDMESVSRWQSPHTTNISLEYGMSTNYTWDNTLNYSMNFGDHAITALLGSEARQTLSEGVVVSGDAGSEHYYKSSFYDVSLIGAAKPTSSYIKTSMLSFFGRLHYVYAGKYIFSATLRRDGSSVLAEGNKWGSFPSVGAAWRIVDEKFMAGTKDWLSNLKFRLSWGVSGNAAVLPYQTLATLSSQSLYYYLGGKDLVGRIPSTMGNPYLKWESTYATNFGLDFGLFNSRISGSVDYYINKTKDLIFLKTAPASEAFPTATANVGDSKGSGLEIALNTVLVKNNNFSYDINWSYAASTDKIVNLTEGIERYQELGATWRIVGERVNTFYDYETSGIWNVGEFDQYKTDWQARHPGETMAYVTNYGQPGTIKIVDRDDNGKLNNDDRKVYNRNPKHIFGMNNTVTYKDFSLSFLLYARLGGYISYDLYNQIYFEPQWTNWGDLDYWVPDGKDHKFPSTGTVYQSVNSGEYKSSLKYAKADYFKIKDITLGYNLPKTWMNKAKFGNIKIYGSLKNFFTFSAVGTYDSERGGEFSFPLAKQAVIGINAQF